MICSFFKMQICPIRHFILCDMRQHLNFVLQNPNQMSDKFIKSIYNSVG